MASARETIEALKNRPKRSPCLDLTPAERQTAGAMAPDERRQWLQKKLSDCAAKRAPPSRLVAGGRPRPAPPGGALERMRERVRSALPWSREEAISTLAPRVEGYNGLPLPRDQMVVRKRRRGPWPAPTAE